MKHPTWIRTLLAVSLATDQPNDLSWGLFRGFRIARRNNVPQALQ